MPIVLVDFNMLVLLIKEMKMDRGIFNRKLLNYIIIVLIVAHIKSGIMMFLGK